MKGSDLIEIIKALQDLGYLSGSKKETGLAIRNIGFHRCQITVDDEIVGIWDTDRKTFVD